MKVLNAYVYRHIRPDTNQVFYIGIGCYQKKWRYERAHTTKSRNQHWKNIVAFCEGVFLVQILMDELTKEEAITKEQEFIKLYGRAHLKTGTLCNLTEGGEGITDLSAESRKKISDSRLGKKNPMYGKKQCPEYIARRTKNMKGASNPNYGKALPQWQKDINRQTQLGRKHTAETIEKRVSQFRKKVINVDTNEIYPSISDVALAIGKSPAQTTRIIKSGKHALKFL